MIIGTDLVKRFDDINALDGTSFHIQKGSVYGLVGPNGSGKSTLIRHIMGIYKPDAGKLTVCGEDPYENISVKSRMAYVPDEIYYTPSQTIEDMAKLYAGVYPEFRIDRLQSMTDIFPELNIKKKFKNLSKGMKKQASLLLAICVHAEILVLDEPMDGLDALARNTVWKLILESVAAHETTVLISSHNLRELEDVCDHVGIMDHGRIIDERNIVEYDEMSLEEMFIKEVGGESDARNDAIKKILL